MKTNRLLRKYQRSEVFRHVIGIAILHTGRLPAQEMPLGIRTKSFNSVQIHPPLRPIRYWVFAHSTKRDPRRGVPDMTLLIDSGLRRPARFPVMVIVLVVEINRQVYPITRRGNLKFAVMTNIGPIVPKEHLDYVSVPKADMLLAVIGRQEQIQNRIRALE